MLGALPPEEGLAPAQWVTHMNRGFRIHRLLNVIRRTGELHAGLVGYSSMIQVVPREWNFQCLLLMMLIYQTSQSLVARIVHMELGRLIYPHSQCMRRGWDTVFECCDGLSESYCI
jgi:hypothetical protein